MSPDLAREIQRALSGLPAWNTDYGFPLWSERRNKSREEQHRFEVSQWAFCRDLADQLAALIQEKTAGESFLLAEQSHGSVHGESLHDEIRPPL